MKIYDLNTRLTFGNYEGKTLEDVYKLDPEFIEHSLINNRDFAIDERSLQKLFEKYPRYEFTNKSINANLDKLDAIEMDDDLGTASYLSEFNDYDDFEETDEEDEDEYGNDVDEDGEDDYDEEGNSYDDNWGRRDEY